MKKCGYVYLLSEWGKDGVYKIGVTKGKLENRIKKLQTGNSNEIYLVDYYETDIPYHIEGYLHRKFFIENVKNEWFELNVDEIMHFKEYCIEGEKIAESLKDNPFFKPK